MKYLLLLLWLISNIKAGEFYDLTGTWQAHNPSNTSLKVEAKVPGLKKKKKKKFLFFFFLKVTFKLTSLELQS